MVRERGGRSGGRGARPGLRAEKSEASRGFASGAPRRRDNLPPGLGGGRGPTRDGPAEAPREVQAERVLGARIEALDEAGVGIGQTPEGHPVVVPGTLPGEDIELAVEHVGRSEGGRKHYGRLWSLKRASSDRVPSPCRKFLICGGCDLLHLSTTAERAFKRRRLADALGRALDEVEPLLASPRDLHYRAVAKLVVGPRGELGSYAVRSHRVVDMRGCKVHAPVIERVAETVRRALSEGLEFQGMRYLVLRAALPRDVVHATLVVNREGLASEDAWLEVLARHAEVAEVWRHVNDDPGDAIFADGPTRCLHRGRSAVGRVGTAEQHLASGAFAQVNPGAAARLYEKVVELIAPEGRRVLDLYSGSGGIALSLLAAGAEEVLGIERTRSAVEAARAAAQGYQGRGRFEVAPVEEVATFLRTKDAGPLAPGEGGGFPAWVLNPPRKGLAPEVIRALIELRPAQVVYVSCSPESLARDLASLAETFTATSVTPVDMFPQTRHVEAVVALSLKPIPT